MLVLLVSWLLDIIDFCKVGRNLLMKIIYTFEK